MKLYLAHFGHGWHGFSGEGFFIFLLAAGLLLLAVMAMTASGQEKK
jgi:hypothetical protein